MSQPSPNRARWMPVTPDSHANRFWRRFGDFGFARDLRSVPLVLAEIAPAAAALPIVFANGPDGIMPHALLRPSHDGARIFVDEADRWRGAYVPSALRAYPFAAAPGGEAGQFALVVNEDSGLLTGSPEDEPFFTPDHQPSAALTKVIAFLQQREGEKTKARIACKALDMAGLLTPLTPGHGLTDSDCAGFLGIDAAALAALPASQAAPFLQSGALLLAHAHLVSLHHCAWLSQLNPATPAAMPASDDRAGLSDFLDALASDAARPDLRIEE